MIASAGAERTVLLVKHLPDSLSSQHKEELLKHFGAREVICTGIKGPLKHAAFARFESTEIAWKALRRLHQLTVLDCTISAEFSKKTFEDIQSRITGSGTDSVKQKLKIINKSDKKEDEDKDEGKKIVSTEKLDKAKIQDEIEALSQKWSVRYAVDSRLRYSYPPPNVGIINNIASALVSVPKFYTQVLHLMNKLHLPAPFGVVREVAPLLAPPPLPVEAHPAEPPVDMEVSSTEESELESEEEEKKEVNPEKAEASAKTNPLKRKGKTRQVTKKKPRLQTLLLPAAAQKPQPLPARPEQVFEQLIQSGARKMTSLKFGQISATAVSALPPIPPIPLIPPVPLEQGEIYDPSHPTEPTTTTQPPQDLMKDTDGSNTEAGGGFGKIAPVSTSSAPVASEDSSSDGEIEETPGKFISSRTLRHGQLSRGQMRDYPVFRNYQSGEPSSRLYVKNLAKQTTEADLRHIYGRYVNWDDGNEKLMFDVRLMKEGRMKGQCFVTLGNEGQAKSALRDTNAYVLRGKPMAVCYARSAKQKVTEEGAKKK